MIQSASKTGQDAPLIIGASTALAAPRPNCCTRKGPGDRSPPAARRHSGATGGRAARHRAVPTDVTSRESVEAAAAQVFAARAPTS